MSLVPVCFGLWEWDFGYAEVGVRGFFIQELVTFFTMALLGTLFLGVNWSEKRAGHPVLYYFCIPGSGAVALQVD